MWNFVSNFHVDFWGVSTEVHTYINAYGGDSSASLLGGGEMLESELDFAGSGSVVSFLQTKKSRQMWMVL